VKKKLSQHSDTIFVLTIVGAFIIGGAVAISQWRVSSEDWNTNFDEFSVEQNEFTDGGVGRDYRIVPIDDPRFMKASEVATWLDERTPVISVLLYGQARAYPLTLLIKHEIVNDQIADMPIAVTYCPLCNSPIVYKRIVEGIILRLGVSGNLYDNNFVMYDDVTESWWRQFTGEAVVGDFTGTMLEIIPSQVVGFASFYEQYPNGLVLVEDTNDLNENNVINPYLGYEGSASPLLNNGDYDLRLKPLDRVLAAMVNDIPIAYSFAILKEVGVVNDIINDYPVVAFWQPGVASALDASTIADSRDVGQAALFGRTLYERRLSFYYEDGYIFDNETDSEWNIFGEAIAGELRGAQLERYTFFTHFWFAWSESYPETLLYDLASGR
jgi:uncharacterized protein DUF3179